MSLSTEIRNSLTKAMREKDNTARNTLRLLVSKIQLEKKQKGTELTDDEIISLIVKEVKTRDEAIEAAVQGNRNDIKEKEEAERKILVAYLPEQMSPNDVLALIDKLIEQESVTRKKEMGKVMKVLMPQIKGKFDGKVAKDMVMNRLED